MSGSFNTSEYVEETNEIINRKIKSTLRKIHKLKRENLVLSDRRKLIKNIQVLDGFYRDDEFIVTYLPRMMERTELEMLLELSERIGKNGNKIQRLRTKISQLKKSLTSSVDEWFSIIINTDKQMPP